MKYPNLGEAAPYFPIAYFANITQELLKEAIKGTEEMTATEVANVCRYTQIPFNVLFNTKLITLDKNRRRHQVMMEELEKKLYEIWKWQKKGSHEADIYMKYERTGYVNLYLNFINGEAVSYCRYLGIKQRMDDTLLYIKCEQNRIHNKPRGVRMAVS